MVEKTDRSLLNKFAALSPPFPIGSMDPRLSPRIVKRGLNERNGTFPGMFPTRETSGRPSFPEEHPDKRRNAIGLSGRFGGPKE